MSDEHTHDDCVQCLQKEVRLLKAALDDANTQIEVRDDAYKTLHEETKAQSQRCARCGRERAQHSKEEGICPTYSLVNADNFATDQL